MTGARSRRTAAGRPRPVLAARAGGGVSRGRGASRRIRRRATTASNQPPRNPWGWLLTAAHSGPLDDRSRNGPGNSAHYLLTGGPTENCFRRSKGIKVVSRPVRRTLSRRSPLTCGNGPISSLSSGKTLLSFVDVRYRSWPSCGPHVVPGLTPVARQAPGRPGKSTKSLKLSVTSGTRWRMQQAAIHLSFCGRGPLSLDGGGQGAPGLGGLIRSGTETRRRGFQQRQVSDPPAAAVSSRAETTVRRSPFTRKLRAPRTRIRLHSPWLAPAGVVTCQRVMIYRHGAGPSEGRVTENGLASRHHRSAGRPRPHDLSIAVKEGWESCPSTGTK